LKAGEKRFVNDCESTRTDHIVFKLAVLPLNHEWAARIIYLSSLGAARENLRQCITAPHEPGRYKLPLKPFQNGE